MTVNLFGTSPDSLLTSESIDYKSFVFSAGETQVRLPDLEKYTALVIESRFPTSQDLIEILMLLNAVNNSKGFEGSITLLLPYLPYSRQDRACYPGEAFSLKVLASLLANELRDVDQVVTWDVHSDVAQYVFSKVGVKLINIDPSIFVSKFISSGVDIHCDYIVVAPDKGAIGRASSVANTIGAQAPIYAEKIRDPDNGAILGIGIPPDQGEEEMFGRKVLIVDDICDGGRTFIELANTIRTFKPSEITLYVTHGIFSKGFEVFYHKGTPLINIILTPNLFPGVQIPSLEFSGVVTPYVYTI